MLGVALGTILLPSLAKHYSDDSPEQYSSLLDWGLRLTLMLALPAALGLAILAVPLISTLFFYGKFSIHDLWMTREALVAYSAGLVGLIMVKVLAPGFYARQNIRTPVKIAIFTLFATQLMNLAFVWKLQHTGLALAIGLGACINASLLYYQLHRQKIFQPQPGWLIFLLKIGIALAVMGATLWYVMGPQSAWLSGGILDRAFHLTWVIVAGAGSYFAALALLGFRPRDYVRRAA
jgi:putative peptidoglycan lipid II flippase